MLHKSFPDFLTDSQRCTDSRFFIDPSVCHRDVLLACLRLMRVKLRRNICQLDDFIDLTEVKDLQERRNTYIGDALEYACQFWASHLAKSAVSNPGNDEVYKVVDEFFKTHFLFWVEVLGLMKNLDIGVHALNDVDQWYSMVSCVLSTWESFFVFMIV